MEFQRIGASSPDRDHFSSVALQRRDRTDPLRLGGRRIEGVAGGCQHDPGGPAPSARRATCRAAPGRPFAPCVRRIRRDGSGPGSRSQLADQAVRPRATNLRPRTRAGDPSATRPRSARMQPVSGTRMVHRSERPGQRPAAQLAMDRRTCQSTPRYDARQASPAAPAGRATSDAVPWSSRASALLSRRRHDANGHDRPAADIIDVRRKETRRRHRRASRGPARGADRSNPDRGQRADQQRRTPAATATSSSQAQPRSAAQHQRRAEDDHGSAIDSTVIPPEAVMLAERRTCDPARVRRGCRAAPACAATAGSPVSSARSSPLHPARTPAPQKVRQGRGDDQQRQQRAARFRPVRSGAATGGGQPGRRSVGAAMLHAPRLRSPVRCGSEVARPRRNRGSIRPCPPTNDKGPPPRRGPFGFLRDVRSAISRGFPAFRPASMS